MNNFFQWLAGFQNRQNKKTVPDSRKEKYLKKILGLWEERTRASMPKVPDAAEEWSKLQCAVESAERETSGFRAKAAWGNILIKPRYTFATAFSVLLIVSSLFLYNKFTLQQYRTDRKEQLTVFLPDSSEVKLNSESKLTVKKGFSENSRIVELKGEAYLKIRKGDFPFVIKTDVASVAVLGTQFNVKSRNNRLEVAVNQGIVEVSSNVENRDSTITLTKDQFSICCAGGFPEQPRTIQFKQHPGWIHGKFTFYQTELKLLCQEIERHFDVSIQITDKQVEKIMVTGLFEAADLDNLISAVCILIEREYRYEDEKFVIF